MRKCTNCGRWRRCNTMDKRRNTPCSDGCRSRKVIKTAKAMMIAGVLIMWYVAAIYGSRPGSLTWSNVIALLTGAGIALAGEFLRKLAEDV